MSLAPGLHLRVLSARDLALFRKLYSDPETMRHIGKPLPACDVEPSFRATLAATHTPQGPWFFAIVETRRRKAIGLCSIRNATGPQRCAEAGLMLIRAQRRCGNATQVLTALIVAAFRALPIDSVWVQYQLANSAAARLCDSVGFNADDGWRPSGTTRQQCVRILQRPNSQTAINQPDRGQTMSNIIGFLINAGTNAAMRNASRTALLQAMQQESIETAMQDTLLMHSSSAIDAPLRVRETMYCLLFPAKAPKKAPAKKKPVKAPPKNKPTKAPAKKSPVNKSPAKKTPSAMPAKKKSPKKPAKKNTSAKSVKR